MLPLCKGERVRYADSPCGASAYARTEKSPYQRRFRARRRRSPLAPPRRWRGASRDGRVVKVRRRQAQQPSRLASSAPSLTQGGLLPDCTQGDSSSPTAPLNGGWRGERHSERNKVERRPSQNVRSPRRCAPPPLKPTALRGASTPSVTP